MTPAKSWDSAGSDRMAIEIQVDPAASPAGEIEREMLTWALSRQVTDATGTTPQLARGRLRA